MTDSYAVYTNTVPAGSFRGFGGPQVAFAYDSHLEMIAHRMNLDPFELRMKNILAKGEDFSEGRHAYRLRSEKCAFSSRGRYRTANNKIEQN